jgi:hypothetical protein
MKREGWAAAVGEIFATRAGYSALLEGYQVTIEQGLILEQLSLSVTMTGAEKPELRIICDQSGSWVLSRPLEGGVPTSRRADNPVKEHPLDLVEWKRKKA